MKKKNKSVVTEFNEARYCYVKNVLGQEIVDLVSQYARFDQQINFNPELAGQQIPGTHSKYGDPLMEALLIKLHPKMEEITGLKLNPTYSYYRVYKPGDELVKHVDRPSCEISCTVCFNYDYKELNGQYNWPIWMVDTPYVMNPGDIIAYHGCELEHWREPFGAPDGSWHVQAFLHYVDANGPYSECIYDGRTNVGTPIGTRQISNVVHSESTPNIDNFKKYIIYTK